MCHTPEIRPKTIRLHETEPDILHPDPERIKPETEMEKKSHSNCVIENTVISLSILHFC